MERFLCSCFSSIARCRNGYYPQRYVVLGIDEYGMKKVLTITIGENESTKYWMTVLNELKNRGVQDILVLCADGLT